MKEFEEFEIEHTGKEDEVKTGFCPILRANCQGHLCMWWVRDWNENKNRFQAACAVTLIAVGVNDEALLRLKTDPELGPRSG